MTKEQMIEFEYRVFPTDDSPVIVGTVTWPKEPGYHKIKDLVSPLIGGGFIEHVSVLHDGRPRDMFVDGDGHQKGMPRNERATAIYRTYAMSRNPGGDPEDLPSIVGPAVLFTKRVWF